MNNTRQKRSAVHAAGSMALHMSSGPTCHLPAGGGASQVVVGAAAGASSSGRTATGRSISTYPS